jgi:predicted transcriptional regulator of viral defense system
VESVERRVASRIRHRARGKCFTPKAFADLGSPEAVRVALHRLEKRGTIRRLTRGLYDFPERDPVIGVLSPTPEEVAKALSERDASRLQPSGAYAANLLGLSEQVPARIVFLTDGPRRHVRIEGQEIALRNTTLRNMATAGRTSGTVIQALRHLGPRRISEETIRQLQRSLLKRDKEQLRSDRIYAPGWMHRIIGAITGE